MTTANAPAVEKPQPAPAPKTCPNGHVCDEKATHHRRAGLVECRRDAGVPALVDEAATAFRDADRLGYRDPVLHCNLAIVYSRQGFLERARDSFRDASRLDPANLMAQSSLLFLRNYEPAAVVDELFAEHSRWGEQLMRRVTARTAWTNDRSPN